MNETKSNLYSAVVFVVFGAFVYIGSFWIPATSSDVLGSRFFPRVVAVIIILLGMIQVVSSMRLIKLQQPEQAAPQAGGVNRPLLLTGAALFVYYVLVLQIGFVITSVLYLLFQGSVLMDKESLGNKRQLLILILVSVILPIAINAIFWNVFQIALPKGKLF